MNVKKLYHISNDNKLKHIYIFSNNDINKDELFSENEKKIIDNVEISHIKINIYNDDTINIIKHKILNIDEFVDYSLKEFYFWRTEKNYLSNNELSYYKKNSSFSEYFDNLKNNMTNEKIESKDEFIIEKKHYEILKPLNINYIPDDLYCHSVNPFLYKKSFIKSVETISNKLLTSNNLTNIDTIYFTTFEELITNDNIINMIELYFPLLSSYNINSIEDFSSKKNKVRSDNVSSELVNIKNYNKYIDEIHNLYDDTKFINSLNNYGVTKINLQLNSQLNFIPLNMLFKSIHAIEFIPLIKYNPSKSSEKIYRIYLNENKSELSKKTTFLSLKDITRIQKKMATNKCISFYVPYKDGVVNSYIIYELYETGNLNIFTEFSEFKTINDLNNLFKVEINKFISKLEEYLQQYGYILSRFDTINSNNIIINEFDLIYNFKYSKKTLLTKKNQKLLFPLYDYLDNGKKLPILFMKRVELYDGIENIGIPVNFNFIDNNLNIVYSSINNLNYVNLLNIYTNILILLIKNDSDVIEKLSKMKINNIESVDDTKIIIEDDDNDEDDEDDEDEIYDDFMKDNYDNDDIISLNNESVSSDNKIDTPESTIGSIGSTIGSIGSTIGSIGSTIGSTIGSEISNDSLSKGGSGKGKGNKEHSNYWINRISRRDKALFDKFKYTGNQSYARTCQSSQNRQPVILTKEEKDNIDKLHPGSYGDSEYHKLEYSTDKDKPYYYICPKYWCMDDNVSLNINDVKKNDSGTLTSNKCNNGEGKIHEFGIKYNFGVENEKKNEEFYYPTFKSEDYCLPCCSKKSPVIIDKKTKKVIGNKNENTKNKCLTGTSIEEKKDDNEQEIKQGLKHVGRKKKILTTEMILQPDKIPLKEHRIGYLPIPIQKLLKIKNNFCKISDKTDFDCLLRYGTDIKENQEFISCMSTIFSLSQSGDKSYYKNFIKYKSFKNLLVESIKIDDFISYQNGNLISLFKKTKYFKKEYSITEINNFIDIEKKESKFYSLLSNNNENDMLLFRNSVISFYNYKTFLLSNESIDYKFTWDLFSSPNKNIFPNGINIVIIDYHSEGNILDIVCPVNYYINEKYDETKNTCIILKYNNIYEPICSMKYNRENDIQIIDPFFKLNTNKQKGIEDFLKLVKESYKKCIPYKLNNDEDNSDDKIINNINLTFENIKDSLLKKYTIKNTVINLYTRTVGLILSDTRKDFFIPCYPSKINFDYKFKYITDKDVFNNYDDTKEIFKNELIQNLQYKYQYDVISNNMITGVELINGLFVPIYPFVKSIKENKHVLRSHVHNIDNNWLHLDKYISDYYGVYDSKREIVIKKIKLENIFYNIFRNKVRLLLNKSINNELRKKIEIIASQNMFMYKNKFKKISDLIKVLIKSNIKTTNIYNENYIKNIDIDSVHNLGIENKGDDFIFSIPKKNLVSDGINMNLYTERVTDEIIRFDTIKIFMFEPNTYLALTRENYKSNNSELLIPQSMINIESIKNILDNIKSNSKLSSYDTTSSTLKLKLNKFKIKSNRKTKKK